MRAPALFPLTARCRGARPSAAAAPVAAAAPAGLPTPLLVDPGAPTTTIQFRMHGGKRITQQFNLSHTVRDVFGFVRR